MWTNVYNGPGNGDDRAAAVVVDSSGNVFVTGASVGVGGNSDYATIKYSGAGAGLWTNGYNGLGNSSDFATALAVDLGGNVFVTGSSVGVGGDFDYVTIKYSGTGTGLWTNTYNGPGNGNDFATALVLDGGGNVIVTGYSIGNSYDYATIKYSNSGVPLWTNRYAGSGNADNEARAVVVDASGNVIVTGYSNDGGSRDYVTLAYSSAGVPLWTNRYNGPANGDDQPQGKYSLAVGPDGSVYVTGASDGDYTSTATYDYATIKYSIGSPRLAIQPDGGAGYFVSFQGVGGTVYELQLATDVTGPWIGGTSQTSPPSGLVEFRDVSPPPGQAFYRVRVE